MEKGLFFVSDKTTKPVIPIFEISELEVEKPTGGRPSKEAEKLINVKDKILKNYPELIKPTLSEKSFNIIQDTLNKINLDIAKINNILEKIIINQ